MNNVLDRLISWLHQYSFSLVATVIVLLSYVVITRIAAPRIKKLIIESGFNNKSFVKANRGLKIFTAIIALIVVLFFWGFDFSVLFLISTSILALTGVAFFANWSVLSNVTCFFVIIFHRAIEQGSYVRVIDGDNYVEGFVHEINIFNVSLRTVDDEVIVYPNNLLISRPIVVNPGKRMDAVGKIVARELSATMIEKASANGN